MQVKVLRHLSCAAPLRIGVLGGSFNPPHAGHMHLAMHALKALQLDYVLWVVALGNPFKEQCDLAAFEVRYQCVQRMIEQHPRMMVTDVEQHIQKRYTIDVLSHLRHILPQHHFVWLMGADGIAGFMKWQRAEEIIQRVPIALFDRSPATHRALRSVFMQRYQHQRVMVPSLLASEATPAWSYVFMPRHPMSATQLRNTLGIQAFM